MDKKNTGMREDALTQFLVRVRFDAEISDHRSYCGSWAIDTSGSGKVPFYLIDKGGAWVHLKGCEPVKLETGDLVLFPRDMAHAVTSAPTPPPRALVNAPFPADCDMDPSLTRILCGYYMFDSVAAQALLDDLPDVLLLLDARNNPVSTGVGHVIDAALLELQSDHPGRTSALCDLARLMLLHLLRGCFAEGGGGGYPAALGDQKIGKALLLMHSRYGEDWTLESLAREVGMSRTSFACRFHEFVGMPPVRYLTAWRMQEASTLLENTGLSLEQIAEKVGYGSDVAFRKAYKRATGLTPKEVRSRKVKPLAGRAARLLLAPFTGTKD